MTGLISSVLERSTLRRWSRAVEQLDTADPVALKKMRSRARRLSQRLDQVLHVAEGRLAGPGDRDAAVRRPIHSDWAWRPEIWSGPLRPLGLAPVENQAMFGREAKIFHDCTTSEITLRQVQNVKSRDVAPFGLRLDVFRFDGSFLSVVLDLPNTAVADLSRRHVLRLDIVAETESPLEMFGRLNLRHGPNVERIVREFPASDGEMVVEFDLSLVQLDSGPIDKVWLDFICEGPELSQIILRDLTMSRRPRAEV